MLLILWERNLDTKLATARANLATKNDCYSSLMTDKKK